MIDRQLLLDAKDEAMAALAKIEEALADPQRQTIDNAWWHASAATIKLVECQCQMTGMSRREKV